VVTVNLRKEWNRTFMIPIAIQYMNNYKNNCYNKERKENYITLVWWLRRLITMTAGAYK